MFNRKSTKALCLGLALAMPMQTVSPISETTVTACAIGGGTLIGALAGWGIHNAATAGCGRSESSTWLLTGLGGAAAGVAAGALIYSIMKQYTPTARFAYAQEIIANLYADPIITSAYESKDSITSRITTVHGTSWPLVAAREALMQKSVNLGSAATALEMAYDEAKQNPGNYSTIMQNYHQLKASIPEIYSNIEQVLQVITNHGKYDQQVLLFEKHMEQVRQQEHEQALQSNQLSHERWENWKDRDHHSYEKSKDREHESYESSKKYQYNREENAKDRWLIASRPQSKVKFSMGGR